MRRENEMKQGIKVQARFVIINKVPVSPSSEFKFLLFPLTFSFKLNNFGRLQLVKIS